MFLLADNHAGKSFDHIDHAAIDDDQLEKIIMTENGQFVLFSICDQYKSVDNISIETKLPSLKVKLLLSLLIKKGLVTVTERMNPSGISEKLYKLQARNIEIVKKIEVFNKVATINFLTKIIRLVMQKDHNGDIRNLTEVTIKVHKNEVNRFIDDLDSLIKKYSDIENEDEDETECYTFLSFLGNK